MAIILNDNIKINAGKPVDTKYLNSSNQPYSSTSDVNTVIPLALRYSGLTVNVGNDEYWYYNGITDTDLRLKFVNTAFAANGLSISGSTVVLGGTLTGNTEINANTNTLTISSGYLSTDNGYQISGTTILRTTLTSIYIGQEVGNNINNIGVNNVGIGLCALHCNTTGSNNVANGSAALMFNTTGSGNIAQGINSGFHNVTGSSNIFLGTCSGYNETSSNRLYIANSAAKSLIYGEFDNEKLCVRGKTYISGLTNASKVNIIYYDDNTNELTYSIAPSNNNIYSKTIITGSTLLTTGSSYVILVNNTVSGTTITLPSPPIDGQTFKIKDVSGLALTNNITITGGSSGIDGIGNGVINTNYGALELMYDQALDQWFSLAFIS